MKEPIMRVVDSDDVAYYVPGHDTEDADDQFGEDIEVTLGYFVELERE